MSSDSVFIDYTYRNFLDRGNDNWLIKYEVSATPLTQNTSSKDLSSKNGLIKSEPTNENKCEKTELIEEGKIINIHGDEATNDNEIKPTSSKMGMDNVKSSDECSG